MVHEDDIYVVHVDDVCAVMVSDTSSEYILSCLITHHFIFTLLLCFPGPSIVFWDPADQPGPFRLPHG